MENEAKLKSVSLEVPVELWAQFKMLAVMKNKTLNKYVNELLELEVEKENEK